MNQPDPTQSRNLVIGASAVIICAIALGLINLVAGRPSAQTTASKPASSCQRASGNIWTDVMLYETSSCTTPFAQVLGGNENRNGQRMVKIRFTSGEVEWKTREAVTEQAYILSTDAALQSRTWRNFLD